MVKLGLLLLGAAALVSASPMSNNESDNFPFIMTDAEASSQGFRLMAVPTDERSPLASSLKDLYLLRYHYGAGIVLSVFHSIDNNQSDSVYYVNQKPYSPQVLLTDIGPLPYGIAVPPPNATNVQPALQPVLFFAGDAGTPVAISDPGKNGGPHVLNKLDTSGEGTFLACKRKVPYYGYIELIVLQYAYNNGSALPDCVPIRLELQCAVLPPPPPVDPSPFQPGPISHKYVKTVPCSPKKDA